MTIKNVFWAIVIAIFAALSLSSCQSVKVKPGYTGIKVYLLGGEKGVDHETVGTGRYWLSINEDMYQFPLFTQNYVWTKNPAEGSPNDESIFSRYRRY